MKKKIKDLTLEECEKLCHKRPTCTRCPIKEFCYNYFCDVQDRALKYKREVEVDESNNDKH